MSSVPSKMIEPSRTRPRLGSSPMIERDSTVLPRARLADDAERLAAVERERHAVDGAHEAAVGLEVGLDVGDPEHRVVDGRRRRGWRRFGRGVAHRPPSRTSKRDRTTSPRKFRASTVKKMRIDGLEHDVRRLEEVAAVEGDDVAPRRRRRPHADTEDRERPLGDDRDRDAEQRDREHRRQHVREQLAHHDPAVLRALGPRGEHEVALRPAERAALARCARRAGWTRRRSR